MPTNKEFELPEDLTFEQALGRLESIVQTLEGDGCELADALQAHAEGVALAQFCMSQLDAAELRVREIKLEERNG